MPEPTHYHIGQDIRGALALPRSRLKGLYRDDQGNVLSPSAVRRELNRMALAGLEVVPNRQCDRIDPQTGRCLGHRARSRKGKRKRELPPNGERRDDE